MSTTGSIKFAAPVRQGTECNLPTLTNAWGPPNGPQNRLGYPPCLMPAIGAGKFRVRAEVAFHAEGAPGIALFGIGWRDASGGNFYLLPTVEICEIKADQLDFVVRCAVEGTVDLDPRDIPTRMLEFSMFWAYQSAGGMLVATQDEGAILWEVSGPE